MAINDSAQTNANDAIRRDNEAIAPYAAQITAAVQSAANGKDAGAALEELLAKLPPNLRAVIIRRFRFEMEEMNQLEARRRREAQQKGQKQEDSRNFMFNLASAAALMTAGTLDRIRSLVRARPDLEKTLKNIGADMMRRGVTADMVKVDATQSFTPNVGAKVDRGEDRGR